MQTTQVIVKQFRSLYTEHNFKEELSLVCNQDFTLMSNLKRHVKKVHEKEKPIKCEGCVKMFLHKSDMMKHFLAVHKGAMMVVKFKSERDQIQYIFTFK